MVTTAHIVLFDTNTRSSPTQATILAPFSPGTDRSVPVLSIRYISSSLPVTGR